MLSKIPGWGVPWLRRDPGDRSESDSIDTSRKAPRLENTSPSSAGTAAGPQPSSNNQLSIHKLVRRNLAMLKERRIPKSAHTPSPRRYTHHDSRFLGNSSIWNTSIKYPWVNPDAGIEVTQLQRYVELRRIKQELHKKSLAYLAQNPVPAPSSIEPISESQRRALDEVVAQPLKKALGDAFKTTIYVEDIQRLVKGRWLNDSIIDVYLGLITQGTDIFPLTTFFYSKVRDEGVASVRKWALRKKLNVLEKSKILVPVNYTDTHWCLAVIDNRARTLSYYDSLGSPAPDVLENIADYLEMEANRVQPNANNHELVASYTRVPLANSPRQENGMDCGVFVCQNAYCSVKGLEPTFSQNDMPVIRDKMAFQLLELCKPDSSRL